METKSKTIPSVSVDVQVVTKMLLKCEVGTVLKYSELTDLIKTDIQSERGRAILQSARKVAQRDGNAVFGTVFGVGIKRLNDSEIANLGSQAIRCIRRKSKRTIDKITCSKYENLSPEDKVRSNAHISLLGAFYSMSRLNQVKNLETKVAKVQDKLSLEKTLEAFAKMSW